MAQAAAPTAKSSPTQFGAFLRKQRQALKLRQHEFAQQVGVSQSYISLLEKGEARPPSKGVCDRIAEIIKHDPRQLWLMTRGADIPFPEIQDLVSTLGRSSRAKEPRDRLFEDEVARARPGPIEHRLLVVCLRRAVGKPLTAAEQAALQGQIEELRARRGFVGELEMAEDLAHDQRIGEEGDDLHAAAAALAAQDVEFEHPPQQGRPVQPPGMGPFAHAKGSGAAVAREGEARARQRAQAECGDHGWRLFIDEAGTVGVAPRCVGGLGRHELAT